MKIYILIISMLLIGCANRPDFIDLQVNNCLQQHRNITLIIHKTHSDFSCWK